MTIRNLNHRDLPFPNHHYLKGSPKSYHHVPNTSKTIVSTVISLRKKEYIVCNHKYPIFPTVFTVWFLTLKISLMAYGILICQMERELA